MSAASLPRSRAVGLRRRWLLGIAATGLLTTLAIAGWSFAWPAPTAPGEIALGHLDDFEPGTVTSYVVTGEGARELSLAGDYGPRPDDYPSEGARLIHIVRLEGGELIAMSGDAPPFGRAIVWYPTARHPNTRVQFGVDPEPGPGYFAEPTRGAYWEIDGTLTYGPAPRDLDEYRVAVRADGMVIVDTGSLIRSDHGRPEGSGAYEQ